MPRRWCVEHRASSLPRADLPERISLAILQYSTMRIFWKPRVSFGELLDPYGYCRSSDEALALSARGHEHLLWRCQYNLCDSEDYCRSIERASYATLSPKGPCLQTRTNCSAQTYQHEIFVIPIWEFHWPWVYHYANANAITNTNAINDVVKNDITNTVRNDVIIIVITSTATPVSSTATPSLPSYRILAMVSGIPAGPALP